MYFLRKKKKKKNLKECTPTIFFAAVDKRILSVRHYPFRFKTLEHFYAKNIFKIQSTLSEKRKKI